MDTNRIMKKIDFQIQISKYHESKVCESCHEPPSWFLGRDLMVIND